MTTRRGEVEQAFRNYFMAGPVLEDWIAWSQLFTDDAVYFDRFASTAQHLLPGDYHAGIFLPVGGRDRVWGHIGLARRARQPFDFTGTSYLRTAVAILSLAVQRLDP